MFEQNMITQIMWIVKVKIASHTPPLIKEITHTLRATIFAHDICLKKNDLRNSGNHDSSILIKQLRLFYL